MSIHKQRHTLNSTSDHAAGTNGTLLGTESSAVAEKAFGTAATAGNIVQRDGSGDVVVPTSPSTGTAATSRDYVNGLTYLTAGDGVGKSGSTVFADVAVATAQQQYGAIVKNRTSDGTGVAGADAGFQAVQTDNSTIRVNASNQLETVAGVFGTTYDFVESDGTDTTSLFAYTDPTTRKVRLTATTVSGNYHIQWSYEVFSSSASAACDSRVQVDDLTTIAETSVGVVSASDIYGVTGHKKMALTAGSHTIDIDFKRDVAAGPHTVSIRRAKISMWRVP